MGLWYNSFSQKDCMITLQCCVTVWSELRSVPPWLSDSASVDQSDAVQKSELVWLPRAVFSRSAGVLVVEHAFQSEFARQFLEAWLVQAETLTNDQTIDQALANCSCCWCLSIRICFSCVQWLAISAWHVKIQDLNGCCLHKVLLN